MGFNLCMWHLMSRGRGLQGSCGLQVPLCHARINALEASGLDGQPSVGAMLQEAVALQQQQELFEMHVSQYLPLTRCQVHLLRPLTKLCWPSKGGPLHHTSR